MTEKLIGYGLAAGVWTFAAVAFPPVAAFGVATAIVTAPTMRRFAEQLEADLDRRETT